jgi:hypothetical protein
MIHKITLSVISGKSLEKRDNIQFKNTLFDSYDWMSMYTLTSYIFAIFEWQKAFYKS